MKIISIPPYKLTRYKAEDGRFVEVELLNKMRAKGQLEGVQIDLDEGYLVPEESNKNRDEEFLARINLGTMLKVKEYVAKGGYDAIITHGTMGMGWFASRMLARIPVVTAVWAGMHVATLLGERFSLIEATDAQALVARHNALLYGLSDKMASVRYITHTSTDISIIIHKTSREQRLKNPDFKEVVDDMVKQCVKCIEIDRADTLVFGCTPLQLFDVEVREGLDKQGYDEIPIVCEYSAAVELAKLMYNMKLVQSPRANPPHSLKAKPEFR